MLKVLHGTISANKVRKVWMCFIQMTNFGHVVAQLEYSKFINIRMRLFFLFSLCI